MLFFNSTKTGPLIHTITWYRRKSITLTDCMEMMDVWKFILWYIRVYDKHSSLNNSFIPATLILDHWLTCEAAQHQQWLCTSQFLYHGDEILLGMLKNLYILYTSNSATDSQCGDPFNYMYPNKYQNTSVPLVILGCYSVLWLLILLVWAPRTPV